MPVLKRKRKSLRFQIWHFYWSFSSDFIAVKGSTASGFQRDTGRCRNTWRLGGRGRLYLTLTPSHQNDSALRWAAAKSHFIVEPRCSMKVEVAALGSPSQFVLSMVTVDVKQHTELEHHILSSVLRSCVKVEVAVLGFLVLGSSSLIVLRSLWT